MSRNLHHLTKSSLLLFVLMGWGSCQRSGFDKEPRDVIAKYVKTSLNAKSNGIRNELLPLTADSVKNALTQLDDAQLKKEFLEGRKEFLALKIRDERPVGPERYSITYEVSYRMVTPNSEDLVTHKKHALLTRISPQESWKISEVQNLKTTIEHQNALSF